MTSIISGRNGKIDFALVRAHGLMIGLAPSELDRLSMLQLFDLFEAYARLHRPGNKLSSDEQDELWEWIQEG